MAFEYGTLNVFLGSAAGTPPDFLRSVGSDPGSAYQVTTDDWATAYKHGALPRTLRVRATVTARLIFDIPPTLDDGKDFNFSDPVHVLEATIDPGHPEDFDYTAVARVGGMFSGGAGTPADLTVGEITIPDFDPVPILFACTLTVEIHPFTLLYGTTYHAKCLASVGGSITWDEGLAGSLSFDGPPEGEPPSSDKKFILPGGGSVSATGSGDSSSSLSVIDDTGTTYATVSLAGGFSGTVEIRVTDFEARWISVHSSPPI